jgi:hypothetical protein
MRVNKLFDDWVVFMIFSVCLISTTLLLFLQGGSTAEIIANLTGLLSVILGMYFSFKNAKFYTLRMAEGRVWLLVAFGFVLCTLGVFMVTIYDRTGYEPFRYALSYLRTIGYIFFVLALVIKLRFAGIKLSAEQKAITGMFMATWIIMIIYVSVYHGYFLDSNYNLADNPYVLLSIADIFIMFVAILIVQMDLTAKGWIPIAVGMFFISIGDTFYSVMREYVDSHGGGYDAGHPYQMIWYVGLYLVAYGAYYQRQIHSKLIDR